MMIWTPLEQRGESQIIVRIDLITNCGFYIIVFLTENLSSGGNRLQKYRECFCKGTVGSVPGFPTNSGSGSIYGGNEQVSFQLWTILQIDGSRRAKTGKKRYGGQANHFFIPICPARARFCPKPSLHLFKLSPLFHQSEEGSQPQYCLSSLHRCWLTRQNFPVFCVTLQK